MHEILVSLPPSRLVLAVQRVCQPKRGSITLAIVCLLCVSLFPASDRAKCRPNGASVSVIGALAQVGVSSTCANCPQAQPSGSPLGSFCFTRNQMATTDFGECILHCRHASSAFFPAEKLTPLPPSAALWRCVVRFAARHRRELPARLGRRRQGRGCRRDRQGLQGGRLLHHHQPRRAA